MRNHLCKTTCIATLAAVLWLLCVGLSTANTPEYQFSYFYQGQAIELVPSARFAAVYLDGVRSSDIFGMSGMRLDAMSANRGLARKGLEIVRLAEPGHAESETAFARSAQAARSRGVEIQPVFEQGGAVLVPSDEVILSFNQDLTVDQAWQWIDRAAGALGVVALREHRPGTFVLSIDHPAEGRVFAVSRALTGMEDVAFAEPNLIVIMDRAALNSDQEGFRLSPHDAAQLKALAARQPRAEMTGISAAGAEQTVGPNWITLASLDFESQALPEGWLASAQARKSDVFWGKTAFRSHGGNQSLYCAQSGSAAAPAPGPAPVNMGAALISPIHDLSRFDEVYLEFWFSAKNDFKIKEQGGTPDTYDLAYTMILDVATGRYDVKPIRLWFTGDMTADPTTRDGWRRALIRVPPSLRGAHTVFVVGYLSDESDQYEGVYIDDLRITATSDIDVAPLDNDPYSGRQYELRNLGQIAGLGGESNDMRLVPAWNAVNVSPDIVVAVVDTGVDLDHPDLNLVTGYNYDGTVGGGPLDPDDPDTAPHGTACAGNVGAIRGNGIGVLGTAPGVKIMPVNFGYEFDDLAGAIDVAVARGADILSNSWGWLDAPSALVAQAMEDAVRAGRTVLIAAGNGPDRPPFSYETNFPCNLTAVMDVICVGASSPTDEHKSASSSDGQFGWGSSYIGAGPDVVAPSPWSYTTDMLGARGYNAGDEIDPDDPASANYSSSFGGTSSSTPKVAGIAALLLSANPDLGPADVKRILMATANDIEEPGFDEKTGAGRVDAHRAVLAALEELRWKTEIGLINLESQAVRGAMLHGLDAAGREIWSLPVNLPGRGRLTLDVSEAAGNLTPRIKALRLDFNQGRIVGYQKFSRHGTYRAGVEALGQAGAGVLHLPLVQTDHATWTGLGLLNTTDEDRVLVFDFNDQSQTTRHLAANAHAAFVVDEVLAQTPFLGSGQIGGGPGISGLYLVGTNHHLYGMALSDAKARQLDFPHLAENSEWHTAVVISNSGPENAELDLSGYDATGNLVLHRPGMRRIAPRDSMIAQLQMPAETAWFRLRSTAPVTGFMVFWRSSGGDVAGFAVTDIASASGVFPKLEQRGWTGLAFVNVHGEENQVTLVARDDAGVRVADANMHMEPGQKWVGMAADLFSGVDISRATHISFEATAPLVGFQLNGSTDGSQLDALPALGAPAHVGQSVLYFPHVAAE